MTGAIHTTLARHPANRIRYQVQTMGLVSAGKVSADAREAISHFSIREANGSMSLLEFKLETGRTHQIRVHAEYMNMPILGDPVYGPSKSAFPKEILEISRSIGRQLLHAKILSFFHPLSGEELFFEAEYPVDFAEAVKRYFAGAS